MSTKLVNYKLPTALIEKIEELSTGNKTALVIDLLEQAIAMRDVKDQTRWYMYEGAKRAPDFSDDHVALRNVLDGLHI